MKQRWIFLLFIIFSTEGWAFPEAPNPNKTSGSLCSVNHYDFEEFRYHENIPYCQRNVSTDEKNAIYRAYGIPLRCKSNYTIDHFIPLSIGGDNDKRNLWPEHKTVKDTRPKLEWNVYLALKNAEINQDEAIDIIYEEKMNPDILERERELLMDCIRSKSTSQIH